MGNARLRARRLRDDESGFTVVELVFAAVILLVVTLSVTGALSFASTSQTMSMRRQQALEIAGQKLEEAQNMRFIDLGTVGGSPVGLLPRTVVQGLYTISQQVSQDLVRGPYYKTVTVIVSWQSPVAGSVKVETGIFDQAGPAAINNGNLIVHFKNGDNDAPVPNVVVTVDPSLGDTLTLTTDASGTVTFAFVPSGQTSVYGDLDGWVFNQDAYASILVTPTITNEITIVGYQSSSCVVHVRDNGSPANNIQNATVTLLSDKAQLATDVNGNAEFDDLFPQTYSFQVQSPGRSTFTGSFTISHGGSSITTEAVLPAAVTSGLLVTVLDTVHQQPIANAKVLAVCSVPPMSLSATTDVNGVASLSATSSGSVFQVSAGKSGFTTSTPTAVTIVAGVTSAVVYLDAVANTPGTLVVYTKHPRDGSARRNIRLHIWSTSPAWDNGLWDSTDWSGYFAKTPMQVGVTYYVQPVQESSRRHGHRIVTLAPVQSHTFVSGETFTMNLTW